MAGRTYTTEAVVLRSFRLGEADRVLHLYTLARGRVGAVAKGIRKTKSRFGARLEPLSHVELMLHEGSGELQTVTGVELLHSHHAARELRELRRAGRAADRLLTRRRRGGLRRVWNRRARALARGHRWDRDAARTTARGGDGGRHHGSLRTRRARGHHGRVRVLRELPAAHAAQRLSRHVRRALGDGIDLDDDADRIDVAAVHDYFANESYWAKGRPYDVVARLVREAQRVVGLYDGQRQVGFARAFTDGVSLVYL